MENCETCALNNAKKKPVAKGGYTRATRTLDMVHTDILGSMTRYQLMVIDMLLVLWTGFLDIQ